MTELDKQFFIGIKISTKLQSQLDNPAPGTERYFKCRATKNSFAHGARISRCNHRAVISGFERPTGIEREPWIDATLTIPEITE